jgi:hypothetical protein
MVYKEFESTPSQMSSEDLDCNGKDSGSEDCWPGWVNIGVPVMISITFLLVLIIMFMVWPKRPPSSDEDEDGQVFVPSKWVQNEDVFQSEGASIGVPSSISRQIDENIV